MTERARPDDPQVRPPKKTTVGLLGIAHSVQFALEEMGPKRSLQTLLRMNHVNGFDCPSCAWPDPDPKHRKMPDIFSDALGAEFGFDPPREHGRNTVEAIRAMREGKVDVFFALGGNFVAATPDTQTTEAAMTHCALSVPVATKSLRS